MLKHPTLDLLGQLGLAGMAKAFAEMESNDDAAGLSHGCVTGGLEIHSGRAR